MDGRRHARISRTVAPAVEPTLPPASTNVRGTHSLVLGCDGWGLVGRLHGVTVVYLGAWGVR